MRSLTIPLTHIDIQAAIVRNPLIAAPETAVTEAIDQMHGAATLNDSIDTCHLDARSSCVLVVDGKQLLGILTERDVVRLAAQPQFLEKLSLREAMMAPITTLRESALTDVASAVALLKRQRIRHLPLLDEQDRVVGLLTLTTLWEQQAAQRNVENAALQAQCTVELEQVVQRSAAIEATLRDSEQRYATLTAIAPVGIFQTDAAGNCRYINERWSQMAGLSLAEAAGDGWLNGVHPEDRDFIFLEWYEAAQANRPFRLEYRFQNAAGHNTWVLGQATAEHDVTGNVIGYVGTITDISDRKQAEVERLHAAQLRHELKLLEQVLDIVLAGYWDWDIPHNQEYLSPGLKRMLGYDDDELPNTPESWQRLIFAEDLPDVLNCFDRHVKSRGQVPYYNEVRYRHRDGSTLWVICSGQVIEWDAHHQPLRMIGCHIDITERKQAETALQESEEFKRRMLESSSDCIKLIDLNGRLQYMNAGGQCIMEIDDFSRCLNTDWRSAWPAAAQPALEAAIMQAKAGQKGSFQGFCPTAKGTPKWWDVAVTPILDEAGQVTQFLAVSRDITDRIQVEEQLLKSAAHLKTAQRIGNFGSWEFDLRTRQIIWSDEVFRIFGRDPESGAPSFEALQQQLHPDDRNQHQQAVQTAIETAQPYEMEFRLCCTDGTVKYILSRGKPIANAVDQNIYLVGTVLDITARKQAEAELQNLSDRLTLAVKSGAIAIWDWDVPQNILTWDDQMYALYGITPDQFTCAYEAWANSLHPDDRHLAETAIQQALTGDKDYEPEFRVILPDGTIRFIKAYALVQRNAEGAPQRMIGLNFDITERKQAEHKLLQTTAQLAASNHELEAFAYSVSHDLRSPLRAIDGFSQALLEDYGDQFNEEGKDYFKRIRLNVKRMGLLIDDLLRLSRVSRSEMQYRTINLSALVQEQVNELHALEPERQVTFVIEPDIILSADVTLMQVALTNLLQNAWKFTSHHTTARIEFGVFQQEGEPVYFVRDDGAGFDMAYANMLFGVFQRLHNTHEFPGTGIGLATVQRAIHRHGGQVWAEGAVENGATIYFTMPNIAIKTGA